MIVEHITVSACRGAFDRSTYTVNLVQWLEDCRPNWFVNDRHDKQQLPAIMPHGIFVSRRADSFVAHSGLVQIDIDAKDQAAGWTPNDSLVAIADLECTVCCGLSASGKGIWALVAVEGINADNHRVKAGQAVSYIRDMTGDELDVMVSHSLASIRFASHDVPFINYDVTPLS